MSESRNDQHDSNSKPEKQPKTQTAKAESLNFHQNKGLNKKTETQKTKPKFPASKDRRVYQV